MGAVRILHTADTHLGFQAYGRLTSDGLNQREVDFQDSFRRVVDHALATRPDLVVHAGDLFDSVRPTNRAIAFALEQVRRLSDARIPTVIVSGNHEAPRLRETGSIFRVFDGLPHVLAAYRGEYERHSVPTASGGVTLHLVPQAPHQGLFAQALAEADPTGPGPHVLVVHGTVAGVQGLYTGELNELSIPHSALRPEYDYVALGHFHNHRIVAPNAAYSGSPERTSFAEAEETKVFLEVEVGDGPPRIHPVATAARTMRDLGSVSARGGLAHEAQEAAIQRLAAADESGALLRIRIVDVEAASLRTLDLEKVRGGAPRALLVDVRVEAHADEARQQDVPTLGSLEAEFEAFLAGRPLPGGERAATRERALAYLRDPEVEPDAA